MRETNIRTNIIKFIEQRGARSGGSRTASSYDLSRIKAIAPQTFSKLDGNLR